MTSVGIFINIIMNRFYVYCLIDPRNSQPFYVGKGSGYRIHQHEKEANKPIQEQYNPKKCKTINDITAIGLSVQKKVLFDCLTEEEAYNKEAEIIDWYGLRKCGGLLTNCVRGGAGGKPEGKNKPVVQYSVGGECIAEFTSTIEAAHVVGIQPSQINGVLKGRAKQAGGFLWTYRGDPTPTYRSSVKKVKQLDVNGMLIKEWPSVKDAVTQLNLPHSSLRECISGKHHTCGGWKWVYSD